MPIEIPTFRDLYDLNKTAALLRDHPPLGTGRLSAQSFNSGFMLDILAGINATAGEEAVRFALELFSRTFIRTASGDALDELADDHFSLTRRKGSAAIGKVKFQRVSASAGPVFIEAGTRVATSSGLAFKTTTPVVMTGPTGLSIVVDVVAEITGSGGNAARGSITQILDPLSDSTVTVNNAWAAGIGDPGGEWMAGGSDLETDAQFRKRIREYLATLRRGTVAALAYGAKIAGVLEATVDDTAYPPRIFIADALDGAGLAGNEALRQAVVDELVNWRAAGVQVNVEIATVVQQSIDVSLTFAAGADTGSVISVMRSSILAAVGNLGIGDTLYSSTLISSARVPGIVDVQLNTPAGNVAPGAAQLIRTANEKITVST